MNTSEHTFHNRFRTLAELTSQIVWTADSKGSVVEDSPSWTAFTGQSSEARRGAGWLEAVDDRDRERVRCSWREAIEATQPFAVEFRLQRRAGGSAQMLMRAAPVLREGETQEWLSINIDITEQHRGDEERTQVMSDQREANRQLVNAAINAQELSDLQELFIGILGHDLRNPLSAILMGAGTLVHRGRLSADDALTVERMTRSTHRMQRMIAQLLDFTRTRLGGGMLLDRQPADLGEIACLAAEELGSRVQLKVEGDLKGVWDADRLAEAFSNLIGNAIQYSAPDTTVLVRAHRAGEHVVAEVENEGLAIPAELLPEIFNPFRRAKAALASRTGNLGLGLFIVEQIVIKHGGTIQVVSANGRTIFTIRLPCVATVSACSSTT